MSVFEHKVQKGNLHLLYLNVTFTSCSAFQPLKAPHCAIFNVSPSRALKPSLEIPTFSKCVILYSTYTFVNHVVFLGKIIKLENTNKNNIIHERKKDQLTYRCLNRYLGLLYSRHLATWKSNSIPVRHQILLYNNLLSLQT